jgi:uncharacterized membrane protein
VLKPYTVVARRRFVWFLRWKGRGDTKMKKPSLVALVLGLLLLASASYAQQFNYASIDVPCSSTPPMSCPNGTARQTTATGINPAGDIVGSFIDGVGVQHGFLLRHWKFTIIDVPGELVGATGPLTTSANGINSDGDIVGNFTVPVNTLVPQDSPAYCPGIGSVACIKGFLYHRGTFDAVLFPGHPGAIPQRISPDGDIYGCLHDFDFGMSMIGAVWTRSGDVSLAANGGELADPSQEVSMSMNNGATPDGHLIVGLWNETPTRRHGFVVKDGVFQSYDARPGVSTLTAIWDINPGQDFVGTYVDSTGRHGFLQLADGSTPIKVDPPGATSTIVYGINPGGLIVGVYTASQAVHGFVAVPVN